MIYKVNKPNSQPIYFVDELTFNSNTSFSSSLGILIIGDLSNAQSELAKIQQEILIKESVRFSICATFVDGNNTTWREVQESDPEDTICQVFDHTAGSYTQVANKTEAYALNEQRKQEFLLSLGLDKVNELTEIPVKQLYDVGTYGTTVGDIPVEVM